VALWADALLAYAYAYDKLIHSYVTLGVDLARPNVSCSDSNGWPLGFELHSKFHQVKKRNLRFFNFEQNSVLQISFDGITGRVQFTPFGERTAFELDIVHLKEDGLSKVRVSTNNNTFIRLRIFDN